MEVPLPLHRPVSCRTGINKQFLRFSTQSFLWQKDHVAGRVSFRVSANFSRRRPRRSSSPRTKDSTPRSASARRRDQKNNEEKEGPSSSKAAGGLAGSSRKTAELDVGIDDEGVADVSNVTDAEEQSVVVEEGVSVAETSFGDVIGEPQVNGGLPKSDNYMELEDARTISSTEVSSVVSTVLLGNTPLVSLQDKEPSQDRKRDTIDVQEKLTRTEEVDMSLRGGVTEENRVYSKGVGTQWSDGVEIAKKEATTVAKAEINASIETDIGGVGGIAPGSNDLQESVSDNTVQSLSAEAMSVGEVISSNSEEEYFLKLKLESEENLRKETLARLAEENFKQGNKIFCYPELVKPDEDIEIFFNRSFSTLKNEPEVLIMGAFNDWKWRSFTIKLSKADLHGDWWSCRFHVPREAYKIDFVLNNGNDVYENNDMKDFCINIEGGMDAFDFENFLLEEKRREQEEIARLEAEKERQAEEQRRIEAEKAASDADRAQARKEVAKRRAILQEMMKKASVSLENVWYVEPSDFGGEDAVRLYYNRSGGPLVNAKAIWIHGGYNSWKDGLSIVSELIRSDNKGVDWWYADVVVPDQALVLDWVFADGPPQQATVYDNNNRQDFHAIVPNSVPDELYWVQEEQEIYRRLQAERRLREEAIRLKVEKTALMKAKTKEATLKTFLLSRKHIVFTEPLDVQAGSTVTLFYNPANTVLNGKPEVWLRCSFNRWTHRLGPLPAQKMVPAQDGPHLKATVKVPLDAYMMDFVFCESEDGGLFDNNNGMDYHIPVFGGVAKEPPMHIVHIAVEMAPIAKVGGLGDVVTSLSRAVQEMNHNVDVILPKYDCLNLSNVKDLNFHKSYSWGGTEIKVWRGKVEGISVYFLEPQNGLFWVGCIYGRGNDGERFGFFCHAALEFLLQSGFHPDIIHCHDWSSAPVSWLFKEQYMHYGLSKARVVFTIHNLDFGQNMIARAMTHTDKATTVSPTYSQEVSGHPAIAPHLYKFHGILNGIDPDMWDPYNDKFIPISYTTENVVEGKVAAKEALQQKLGLKKADLPLVGIITRLTHQKGIHLIKHAIWRTLERNGQVVLLGSAPDPRIQNDFVNLANQLHSSHNDRARLCLTYDEPLSHLIYAGADFILVPSIFEPCGLTQLTAMRYGSIPVVRKTGGLYDTVFDVDHDKERAQACGVEPNGFSFDGADAAGVDYALNRALSTWYDGREWFNSLCKRVMEQDWSWNRPALDYLELYHAARK